MRELATRANTTSSTINKLEKGITRLNTDWLTRLAVALEVELQELVKTSDSESAHIQQDDVEPYQVGNPQGFASDIGDLDADGLADRFATQSRYIVKSHALDQIGIFPKSILISDASPDEISRVKTGSIVIAQLRENGREATILRQFLEPSILATNSSMQSPPVINLRLQDAVIKGVIVASYRSHKPTSGD